jgi:hypothetical protein
VSPLSATWYAEQIVETQHAPSTLNQLDPLADPLLSSPPDYLVVLGYIVLTGIPLLVRLVQVERDS